MLSRGGSGAPPPPPSPPPPSPPPPHGEEEEDSDKEEFLAQLPTDVEAKEAAAEQRAILASFETQRCDRAAQELMAAERRATATRLTEDHAAARADAHRRNIEATRAAMTDAEQRLFRADVAGGLTKVARSASVASISTLSPPSMHRHSERWSAAPSPHSSRRPSATAASARQRRIIAAAGWFPATRPMTELGRPTLHRHHQAHREPPAPVRTPTKTTSFSLFHISP
jgi:hypothetical protein